MGTHEPPDTLTERSPEDRLVDEFIAQLLASYDQSLMEHVLTCGDQVVEFFYGGDLDRARSNNPQKPAALNRLFQRAPRELPLSVSALKRAVRLSIQYRDLPAAVGRGLSVRHQMALLPVHDLAEKVRLGEQAVEQHLSAEQLIKAVRKATGRDKRRGSGRRPMNPLVKHMNGLERATRIDELAPLLQVGALRVMSAKEIAGIERQVKAVREQLERVGDAIARARRG